MAEKLEDLYISEAAVSRIVKETLPDGVSVSQEARVALSKAASIFVLYITHCANCVAMRAKRKTLNPEDVLAAMEKINFGHFLQPLQRALEFYKKGQMETETSGLKRKDKVKKSRETEVGGEED